MQTLTSSVEQHPRSLHMLTTSIEHPHIFTPTTTLSSPSTSEHHQPTSTQSHLTSSDIRPSTPEITYPYSLYKTEEHYNRKLALMMKPNQVSL